MWKLRSVVQVNQLSSDKFEPELGDLTDLIPLEFCPVTQFISNREIRMVLGTVFQVLWIKMPLALLDVREKFGTET